LQDYRLPAPATKLSFSGRGLLATASGDMVDVYKDCCTSAVKHPYLRHKVHRNVAAIAFSPFEDVIGVGHAHGFQSVLVPGAGAAGFDALEVNPYQSKSQRREAEVKALLEKIPADLISLEPDRVGEVDTDAVAAEAAAKSRLLSVRPPKIDFEPRPKTKGRGGTAKRHHVKRTVAEEERRRAVKQQLAAADDLQREGPRKKSRKAKPLLDRLK